MKLPIYLTALLITYLFYGFYLWQSDFTVVSNELKPENPVGFYDYRGVSNVRTTLSDGSETPSKVISQAKLAGLDYLVLTDSNQFPVDESSSAYHGNLLVMTEGEYSFLDSRLFYYSTDWSKFPENPAEASLFFTDHLSQQSYDKRENFLVLAHPFNPDSTWTGNYPPGLDGIEILNPRAISQKAWRRSQISVLWSFLTYPFNPKYSFLRIFREPSEELALWDKLTMQRPTVGFSGLEASARAIPIANYLVKFPSYYRSFEMMSNHIILRSELIGNYAKDKLKIFAALRSGQFYMSLDILGDPKGFNSVIRDGEKIYLLGSNLKLSKNLHLITELPRKPKDFYEIVLFRNGERVMTINETVLDYKITEPGVYRVVVRVSPTLPLPDGKKWIGWIYTNPFYVQ